MLGFLKRAWRKRYWKSRVFESESGWWAEIKNVRKKHIYPRLASGYYGPFDSRDAAEAKAVAAVAMACGSRA